MHVAHFSCGVMIAPLGDPSVAEFADGIPLVNALAERSEGFVWRYPGDEAKDAAALGRPLAGASEPVICSFSVWRSIESFDHFVHQTAHGRFMRRRDAWFVSGRSEVALWGVVDGRRPSLAEALDRLDQLRRDGPGDDVFTPASWRAARQDGPSG